MRFGSVNAMLILGLFSPAMGDVITPVEVVATSEFGAVDFLGLSDVFAEDLIDGGGLSDILGTPGNILDDMHDNDVSWSNGWHSGDFDAGIPGGTDNDGDPFTAPLVDDQIIEFDLGAAFAVTHAHIWQQNQSGFGVTLALDRGVDEFEILYSKEFGGDSFTSAGIFNLQQEEGETMVPAQVIEFAEPVVARRIRFDINTAISLDPNEFVGLGEVRFEGIPIPALPGDFNQDLVLDAIDIDMLSAEVRAATNMPGFDLNGDAVVDDRDRIVWVESLAGTRFGDANMDRVVDEADFDIWLSHRFQMDTGWGTADFDGDGATGGPDFNVWNDHRTVPPAGPSVPEPAAWPLSRLDCGRALAKPQNTQRQEAIEHPTRGPRQRPD